MSEVKVYYVLTAAGHLPLGFCENKEDAERVVSMTKRSNDPDIFELVAKSYYDTLKSELSAKDLRVKELEAQLSRITTALDFEMEHIEFEKAAELEGLSMRQHPLHYLFLDEKTNMARQIWKSAIYYLTQQHTPKSQEGPTND